MNDSTSEQQSLWPELIESLPEADLPIEGLQGRSLKCGDYWVLFLVADREVTVPTHHHEAQWGIVLSGSMELTIGQSHMEYHRGDTHYIPAAVDHSAVLHAGWQGVYIFKRK